VTITIFVPARFIAATSGMVSGSRDRSSVMREASLAVVRLSTRSRV
jgi:hypothetical protein